MKKGKQITTILNNEQLEIFEQYKEENNVTTNYEALRLMIGNLPKFSQNVDNSSLLLSGNVDEDRKLLDSMPRKTLEEKIRILDSKNRKEKNTIKRTGAFHNENFREDLTSLLCGEVDLYEVNITLIGGIT